MSTDRHAYLAGELAAIFQAHPDYGVVICDNADYPGTNWADEFAVEIDDAHRVIRLVAECT